MPQNKKPKANADTKPEDGFDEILSKALKAQGLANKYQGKIGGRLSAGFLTSFDADITAIGTVVPAVKTTRGGQMQLTATQATACERGHKIAMGFRTTVKAHTGDPAVLLAYGVGAKLKKESVTDVKVALKTILDRVQAQPAEAASFDIVPEDTLALQSALDAITKADTTQETARANAPQTTKTRNITARRLLDGIKKIAGAGMRANADDPTVYANFKALITKNGA